jgi:hypothetical protein
MSSWLKAGLIGGAVLALLSILLTFLGQTLGLECAIELLTLLVFAGIGALAAYWMPPIRQAGPAAGQGALAAVLAQLIGGIVLTILSVIRTSFVDTSAVISNLDPALLDSLVEMGLDVQVVETMMGPAGAVLSGSLCCLGGLIFAAILGAVGGALFAAIKSD